MRLAIGSTSQALQERFFLLAGKLDSRKNFIAIQPSGDLSLTILSMSLLLHADAEIPHADDYFHRIRSRQYAPQEKGSRTRDHAPSCLSDKNEAIQLLPA